MQSSAALSLLFLLPGISAAALPQIIGNELERSPISLKRDLSGNLVPRLPKRGEILPPAAVSLADDSSLHPLWNVKRTLSARSPQGPASNPGEFTDFGIANLNPANHHTSGSHQNGSSMNATTMVVEVGTEHHRYHNGSHHHHWNSTHHENRTEGILTEFNAHGEHIVVYNGTHYPNGTRYSPANTTVDGGNLLGETVVSGDEVAVYRQPWNKTCHRYHRYNDTGRPVPTATGIWLPSGTGWIPAGTARPSNYRKVPSTAYAGFRGPKIEKVKIWEVVVREKR